MRLFSFLSKVAVVCNLCFLLCVAVRFYSRYKDMQINEALKSVVVITGWLIAPILCIVVNLVRLGYFLRKKPVTTPHWINLFNFFVLLAMIAVLFYS
jgi:cytochrome bd-type quinol oxidase subunit 2